MATPDKSGVSSGTTALGLAILGCLVAGAVGIYKTMGMHSGVDVFLGLAGTAIPFGIVFFIYFRRER